MTWVEVDGAGWSWVELGARFSNTHLFLITLGVAREFNYLNI